MENLSTNSKSPFPMLPKTKVSDLAHDQQAQAHRLQIRLSKGGWGLLSTQEKYNGL